MCIRKIIGIKYGYGYSICRLCVPNIGMKWFDCAWKNALMPLQTSKLCICKLRKLVKIDFYVVNNSIV